MIANFRANKLHGFEIQSSYACECLKQSTVICNSVNIVNVIYMVCVLLYRNLKKHLTDIKILLFMLFTNHVYLNLYISKLMNDVYCD